MTNGSMLRVFCTVLLTVSMQTVFAGDAAVSSTQISRFRYPTTKGYTVDRVDLIARVERALSRYAAACATRDEKAMAEVFTDFAVIAYASSAPGRFIASGAIAAEECWAAGALTGTSSNESPIWIYPTSDPNDVLIQYTVVPGAGTAQHEVQDIALVEMAGDRISQIRDYMTRVDLEP
ncbi:MAG: hypothetical protein QOI59_6913 [Gammaproteobacteria bacterium]|jgi:hypothetical protein|nr:hypothetical protein [Gammaproteobacteria bacterium]